MRGSFSCAKFYAWLFWRSLFWFCNPVNTVSLLNANLWYMKIFAAAINLKHTVKPVLFLIFGLLRKVQKLFARHHECPGKGLRPALRITSRTQDMKMDNMKSEGMKSDDMKTKEMKAKEMKKKAKTMEIPKM